MSAAALPFTFYDAATPPTVSSASATYGPTSGGGDPPCGARERFAPTAALRCRFLEVEPPAALGGDQTGTRMVLEAAAGG